MRMHASAVWFPDIVVPSGIMDLITVQEGLIRALFCRITQGCVEDLQL